MYIKHNTTTVSCKISKRWARAIVGNESVLRADLVSARKTAIRATAFDSSDCVKHARKDGDTSQVYLPQGRTSTLVPYSLTSKSTPTTRSSSFVPALTCTQCISAARRDPPICHGGEPQSKQQYRAIVLREGIMGCGDMEILAYDFERATRSVLRRHGFMSITSALCQSYPRRVFFCAKHLHQCRSVFLPRAQRGNGYGSEPDCKFRC